jgi:DNA-binding SARP family transcriptional activator
MLDEKLDVNSKVKAATFLLSYCNLATQLDLGSSVYRRALPLLKSPDVTPLNELWWFLRVGYYHAILGDLERSHATLQHARDIAERHGLSGLCSAALIIRSYQLVSACKQGDLEAGQRLLAETEALALPSRPMDSFHVTQPHAYLAMLRRNTQDVSRWGHAAYLAAQKTGMTYIEVLALAHEAHGLAAGGETEALRRTLSTIRELIEGTYLTYIECEVRYILAYAGLVRGWCDEVRATVEDAVTYARAKHYYYPNLVRFSVALPAVLAACLEHGIETEYASGVIRRYRLRPVCDDLPDWPWPIRICTLGAFEVHLDGAPLRFTGKIPRRPLALLKAIVANGGAEVRQPKLIDALWPDEEGDAGKQSFGVTMVRLRKLLGSHEAIVVADERVSLNPALCWVDAQAFEAKLKRADAASAAGDAEGALAEIQGALSLYKGAFLPNDPEERWSVQMRLRLRGLFTAAIEDLGRRHETRGEWERAIACYRRGLEADDLVEEFYLGQMRCYLAKQRRAEGMAVFRRLRQTLSVVLGVAPSPASEAVARALQRAGQAVTEPDDNLSHP